MFGLFVLLFGGIVCAQCPPAPKVRIHKESLSSIPEPSNGKAMVVVMRRGNLSPMLYPVSVDGQWVGANAKYTYFFFEVGPGEHELCTGGAFLNGHRKSSGATLNAEAGKTYYFEQSEPFDDTIVLITPVTDTLQISSVLKLSRRSTLTKVEKMVYITPSQPN
jgi:hypothetical protein